MEPPIKFKRWFTSLAVLAGVIMLGRAPLLITIAVALVAGMAYPAALRPLRLVKFWLAIGLLVIIVPLFAGVQDSHILWFDYSSAKLAQTWLMALRGIVVFLLIQVLTVELDSEQFTARLAQLGNRNFVTLYELSREIIPNVRHILHSRLQEKRKFTLGSLSPRKMLTVVSTVFIDLIRLAENLTRTHGPRLGRNHAQVVSKISGESEPCLLIVTGGPGSGKTTWLEQLAAELGTQAAGIITKREYLSDDEWRLALTDLGDGATQVAGQMAPLVGGVATENYWIDPAALAWGAQRLAAAAGEWLLVDEVGIFEFNLEGFYPGLQAVDENFSGHLVIGLRKTLLVELDDWLTANLPRLAQRKRFYIILDEDEPK